MVQKPVAKKSSTRCDAYLNGNNEGKKFEKILLEAIDEAFLTLGKSVKKAIYYNLEQKFIIPRRDIPYRLDDFSDALEQIFGVASKHLEILIMKELHEKIVCYYEWNGPSWLVPDLTFTQYVKMLRLCFEDKGKIGELEVWIDAEEKQKQHI